MAANSIVEELPPVLDAQKNRMKVHEGEIDEESRYVQSRYFLERPINELKLHFRMLESSFKSFVDEHKSLISLIPLTCSRFLKCEQNSYAAYRQKYMTTVLAFETEIKRKESLVIQQRRDRPRDIMNSRFRSESMTSGQWDSERMARNDGYSPSNDPRGLLSLDQRYKMRIRSDERRSQNFDKSRVDTMSTSSAGNTDEDVLDLYADDDAIMDFAIMQPVSSASTISQTVVHDSDNRLQSAVVIPDQADLRTFLNDRAVSDTPNQPVGHEIANEQKQPNGCRCCNVMGHSLTKCSAFLQLPRAADRSALILRWKLCINCFIKFRTGKKAKPHKCLAGSCINCPGVKPHHPLLCSKTYP